LCRAGSSWPFDRAAANLKEFCGPTACDNTIRAACQDHGGAMRDWQRDAPAASAPFRSADGGAEFPADGTMVSTAGGWREMRPSVFAKRHRGEPAAGRDDWGRRGLPAPHARVIRAGVRTDRQLGPSWRRMAERLGVRDASAVTAVAGGARWIWKQLDRNLPGCAGVPDVYHACGQLWAAANARFGEGSAQARAWAEGRRATLLRSGAAGLLVELAGPEWSGVRGNFEPHLGHTDYAGRLAPGRSIGSGLAEGSCKQVIGRRLKQTGARWKVRWVELMAALCAVQAGGQWNAYWAEAANAA
jgi:hypothetical protein